MVEIGLDTFEMMVVFVVASTEEVVRQAFFKFLLSTITRQNEVLQEYHVKME